MTQCVDKFGRPVSVGSRIRLIQLSPEFLESLPCDEFEEISSMIGAVFTVYETDEFGRAWIEKSCNCPDDGKFMSHSLGLDGCEMEIDVDASF